MTYDELLAEITAEFYSDNTVGKKHINQHFALRAVVELHKPKAKTKEGEDICGCAYGAWTFYPCPTIQAIEKELK